MYEVAIRHIENLPYKLNHKPTYLILFSCFLSCDLIENIVTMMMIDDNKKNIKLNEAQYNIVWVTNATDIRNTKIPKYDRV